MAFNVCLLKVPVGTETSAASNPSPEKMGVAPGIGAGEVFAWHTTAAWGQWHGSAESLSAAESLPMLQELRVEQGKILRSGQA